MNGSTLFAFWPLSLGARSGLLPNTHHLVAGAGGMYADLKACKAHPSPEKKTDLEDRFDALFTTQTSFETLNQTLRRIHRNKAELV
jgi:hypothetical protein